MLAGDLELLPLLALAVPRGPPEDTFRAKLVTGGLARAIGATFPSLTEPNAELGGNHLGRLIDWLRRQLRDPMATEEVDDTGLVELRDVVAGDLLFVLVEEG